MLRRPSRARRRVRAGARARGHGERASARQLHRQPPRRDRARGRPRLRPLRRSISPRSRPSSSAPTCGARLRGDGRASSSSCGSTAPRVPLRAAQRIALSTRDGAGGPRDAPLRCRVQRAGVGYVARRSPTTCSRARIGWREITISARDGARLVEASVPARASSNALRAYPRDLLRSPLDVRAATASLRAGPGSAPAPGLDPAPRPEPPRRRLRGADRARRAVARRRPALAARSRPSGALSTPSPPGTGRRSSPATSSARVAGRATRSRSGPR